MTGKARSEEGDCGMFICRRYTRLQVTKVNVATLIDTCLLQLVVDVRHSGVKSDNFLSDPRKARRSVYGPPYQLFVSSLLLAVEVRYVFTPQLGRNSTFAESCDKDVFNDSKSFYYTTSMCT